MVKGDLQDLDAGKIAPASTIKAINLNSTSGTAIWVIHGNIGALNVKNDLRGAEIRIDDADAKLGALNLGGSLFGGTTNFSGRIVAGGGHIGAIKIGGDFHAGERDTSGNLLTDTGVIFALTGTRDERTGAISPR